MPRYIDAEKLCELARNHIDRTVDCNDIMRFPFADVQEVRHGRWILPQKKGCLTYDESAYKECSECGEVTFLAKTKCGQMNYCPNCGAKMDLED